MFSEKKKEKKIIIIVDYMNVNMKAAELGKIVDLKKLKEECLEIGIVKDSFIGIPSQYVTEENITRFYNAGFKPLVAPKYTIDMKDKDRVDSILTDFAERNFDENSDITDIVVVTHDGDFIPLANFMKDRKKNVILYGIQDISNALIQVVDELKLLPLISE